MNANKYFQIWGPSTPGMIFFLPEMYLKILALNTVNEISEISHFLSKMYLYFKINAKGLVDVDGQELLKPWWNTGELFSWQSSLSNSLNVSLCLICLTIWCNVAKNWSMSEKNGRCLFPFCIFRACTEVFYRQLSNNLQQWSWQNYWKTPRKIPTKVSGKIVPES